MFRNKYLSVSIRNKLSTLIDWNVIYVIAKYFQKESIWWAYSHSEGLTSHVRFDKNRLRDAWNYWINQINWNNEQFE